MSFLQYIGSLFICCKSRIRFKKKKYLKGVKLVEDEIDVINIIRKLRRYEFAMELLLSKYQRKFLKFDPDNLLEHKEENEEKKKMAYYI